MAMISFLKFTNNLLLLKRNHREGFVLTIGGVIAGLKGIDKDYRIDLR